MEREDFIGAAQYLQLTSAQRRDAESLSNDLRTLIDSQLHENIGHMSDQPGGSPDDSLPADREHIGPMNIRGKDFYIELVRIRDPANGQIWLISSDTLRDIPAMAGRSRQDQDRAQPRRSRCSSTSCWHSHWLMGGG